jgi:small-conductance mechanosensitive channel
VKVAPGTRRKLAPQAVERDQADGPARSPGDGTGITLLLLFTLATMIVVGAIWMLAALGGWWMLALAIAVHLAMTSVVLRAVVAVADERASVRARDHG